MSFHFTGQDSLEHCLLGRSSDHKLPQLLFIWKYLNLSLTLNGQFLPDKDSWLIGGGRWRWGGNCTLNILMDCLLAFEVSDERAAANLTKDHLWQLTSVRIHSFLAFSSLIMCLSVDLFWFILFGVFELLVCFYSHSCKVFYLFY